MSLAKPLRVLGAALVLLILLAGGAALWLGTSGGAAWLGGVVGRLSSKPGARVAIGALALTPSGRLTVTDLRLGDAQGDWLSVDRAIAEIRLLPLLGGRIEIARLTVGTADLDRLPSGGGAGGGPPGLRLDSFDLARLRLGPAIAGTPVALTASGRLVLGSSGDRIELAARRTDGVPGALTLRLDYAGDSGNLAATAQLDEPSGALLERLAGRKAPLTLRLAGTGRLDDWHGTLAGRAGTAASLDARLAIARTGAFYAATAEGEAAAPGFVPARFARLLDPGGVRFAARITTDGADLVRLDRLALSTATAELTAAGRYGLSGGTIAGTADIQLRDLAALAPLVDQPIAGTAGLRVEVGGTLAAPIASATLTAANAAFAGSSARRITAAIDIALPPGRFRLSASGHIAGLAFGAVPLPPDLAAGLGWRLGASGTRALDTVELDGFELAAGGARLDIAGRLADDTMSGRAGLVLPDLSQEAGLVGGAVPGLAGTVRLDADISATLATGAASVRLTGGAERLRTGIAALDAATGGRLGFAATVQRSADGALGVDGLDLSGADLRLTGSAALPPGLARIAAKLSLALPRLAPLSPGSGIGGRLTAAADLAGPWSALAGTVQVAADRLALRGTPLGRLDGTVAIGNLAAPAGRMSLRFAGLAGLAGTVAGDVSLQAGSLALSHLDLRVAGARLSGDLTLDPARRLARGTVAASLPDLAPFSRLAGMPLAGRIEARATLRDSPGQAVEFTASGRSLGVGAGGPRPLAVAQLAAQGRLSDLFGTPAGSAELSLSGARLGAAALDATLTLASTAPGRFRLAGKATGRLPEPLQVALAADARLGAAGQSLAVTRLDGGYAGTSFALTRPLRLERRVSSLAFTDLAVSVGSGRLSGEGRLAGETVALTLRGRALPLGLAARLAGNPEITGRVGVELDLAGTLRAPRGRLLVTGADLRFASASRPDLPALSMSALGQWQDGRVELRGRVDAPSHAAIGFHGSGPLELRRQPFAIVLPPTAPITLAVEGAGDLAELDDLLPLGEDRLAGRYDLAVSVSGTLAVPVAGGHLAVTGGRFEDFEAGTILSGIDLAFGGEGRRFVLQRFSASDGGPGRLTGEGAVQLGADAVPDIDLRIRLQHFRAVRRDDAQVTASGTAALSGTLAALRLAATITVDKAELNIPDQLPASVPTLAVQRIDSRTGTVQQPAVAAAAPALPVVLAVTVGAAGQVFVRGHGLDSEWRGAVKVGGTSAAPAITGDLRVVNGTFSLLGRDFVLARGSVRFPGGRQIDPMVDIVADATTTGLTVEARLSGTASAPKVELTSLPQLPQDEILSQLLFGTSVGQITPLEGVQLAQAAASLTGGGGSDILGTVRRDLGLDRLSFGSASYGGALPGGPLATAAAEQQQAAGGTAAGTTLQAGKYVAPGVYVGVEQGAGVGESQLRVQGDITRHLSIDTTAGALYGESIGLDFKLDY